MKQCLWSIQARAVGSVRTAALKVGVCSSRSAAFPSNPSSARVATNYYFQGKVDTISGTLVYFSLIMERIWYMLLMH